jgi:hypothetical protein
MLLTHQRFSKGTDSTISNLFMGVGLSKYFFCHILEDEQRAVKFDGKTRIPSGYYEIKIRHGSAKFGYYDDRFADIGHHGMLHIQDVPNFTWVYIHPGNDHEDTDGCLLPGFSHSADHIQGGGTVGRSVEAYKALYKKVHAALLDGEQVFIDIRDEEF